MGRCYIGYDFFGGDNVKSEKEIPIRNVEIPFEIQGKVK